MAINSADKLVVVKAFAMGNPLPLDAREIYDSFAEAKAYAASSPIAYAGQTIKVVEGGNVSVFNLVPSTVEGENFALALAVSGTGAVQGINTSSVEGNITVQSASGDTTASVDVPIVGALVNPVVDEEAHTLTLTKLGATVDKNAEVVIPLGGASPDTMVSVVEAGDEALAIKVTTFDAETEEETSEIIKIFGAVTGVDTSVAGVVDVAVPGADGTVAHTKQGLVGAVINASFDEDTQTITLPVVTGVDENGAVTTSDVTVDLKAGVIGAFVDVTATADTETASAKYTFSYKQEDGSTATKEVYETGVRKVELDATNKNKVVVTKADTTGALTTSELLVGVGSVMSPAYDADTRKITLNVLQADGTTSAFEINLGKDMVVKSGSYNTETHDIELVLTDDSVVKIPATSLVDVYTGDATTTATVTVSDANVITVAVKVSTKEGNLLKSDENGLYVVESDFTATQKLITDAQAAAEKHADDKIGNLGEHATMVAYADAKIAQEVIDRDAAIATAKGEATKHADDKIGNLGDYTTVVAYADAKAADAQSSAEEAANGYTDTKVGNLGDSADVVSYVDAKAGAAEEAANGYTDTKVGNLGDSADVVTYVNTKAGAAETAANGYTDGKIAQEVTDRDAAIATAKGEAIQHTTDTIGNLGEHTTVVSYVDDKAQDAEEAANGYTDGKIAEEEAARNTAIEAAQAAAEKHADDIMAQEVIDRNSAIATAEQAAKTHADRKIGDIGEAADVVSYVDAKAADAQSAAEKYADDKIGTLGDYTTVVAYADAKAAAAQSAAEGTANGYTDGKIAQEVTDRDAAIATAKAAAETSANGYTDQKIGNLGESATVAEYVNAQIQAATVKWIDFSEEVVE